MEKLFDKLQYISINSPNILRFFQERISATSSERCLRNVTESPKKALYEKRFAFIKVRYVSFYRAIGLFFSFLSNNNNRILINNRIK